MRILHVLPGMSAGGMEAIVIQLAADAVAHGDQVMVASATGDWVGKVVAAGAVHCELPATGRGLSAVLAGSTATAILARCINKLNPHIIHAHNVRATAMARLAATTALRRPATPRSQVPRSPSRLPESTGSQLTLAGPRRSTRPVLVPTLHGLAPADYATASQILRLCARRVIACAPSVARSLSTAGFARDRIDIITNGAELVPASPERLARMRADLGLDSERLIVGIGRLVPQKNWPVFVAAVASLTNSVGVVAGDGPLRGAMTDLAARSGGFVRFIGAINDIPALVGLAECVVSTSIWEGLPLAVLEALSLGVPVVTTAVDGVVGLVPADAALQVPPDDPEAVAAAIDRILADSNLAARLRANALAAAPGWGTAAMLAGYRHAYQAALASAPRWV